MMSRNRRRIAAVIHLIKMNAVFRRTPRHPRIIA